LTRDWLGERREVQIWGAGPDGKKWRHALLKEGVRVVRFFDIDPRKIGGKVGDEVPVLDAQTVAEHRGIPLLGAVGVKGARAEIQTALNALGWVEGEDHFFVQ
jgi:NADH/NAD ratio-sensing transcriptional regulator Rex